MVPHDGVMALPKAAIVDGPRYSLREIVMSKKIDTGQMLAIGAVERAVKSLVRDQTVGQDGNPDLDVIHNGLLFWKAVTLPEPREKTDPVRYCILRSIYVRGLMQWTLAKVESRTFKVAGVLVMRQFQASQSGWWDLESLKVTYKDPRSGASVSEKFDHGADHFLYEELYLRDRRDFGRI